MEEFGSICREVLLWPEGVPSSNGLSGAEQTLGPGLIGNVSVPVLYVYPASQPCGQAVILCPGGGFRGVAVEQLIYNFAFDSKKDLGMAAALSLIVLVALVIINSIQMRGMRDNTK